MRIKLLTSFANGLDGPTYRRGKICVVPDDIDRGLAKRLLDSHQAVILSDEPETEMLVGGESGMLPAGRHKRRR